MNTGTHTEAPQSDPYSGCGPDCVLIDGTCRCRYGEIAASTDPKWMDDIDPPY